MDQPALSAVAEVLEAFDVDSDQGLTAGDAARRADRHGPNQIEQRGRETLWRLAVEQFKSVIIALLAAAGLLAVLVGAYLEAIAIGAALLVNAVIGFLTELRARKSIEALQSLDETTARVRRDGEDVTVPVRDLVPGDVALLGEGDLVGADLRIIDSRSLRVDESALTGESVPVDKHREPVDDADAPLAERASMAFKGTAVTSGFGTGVVVSIGGDTEIGRIARMAGEAEGRTTPLERRLDALGTRLIWVTTAAAVVIAGIGIIVGRDTRTIVETSIALGLAAVPEGLPVVASLALARGAYRLAKANAVVKRLSAVETLGSAGIIMTDKTGTLTEGTMRLDTVVVAGGRTDLDGRERGDDVAELIRLAALCTDVGIDDEGERSGNPMEMAILERNDELAGCGDPHADCEQASLEPFDPERKMMAVTYECGDGAIVVAKGAPAAVLDACDAGADRAAWDERNVELAGDGLRVLAVAAKEGTTADEIGDPLTGLEMRGLLGFLDPVREGVAASIAECDRAGIRVIVVTGDQTETAVAIAREVGLEVGDADSVRGDELPGFDDLASEERDRWRSVSVFSRVAPEHKLDLITLHQDGGSVVAMTGDGVNDAPALEQADIGVAMGRRGTDVASEAADIVLRDDSFGTIVEAIRSGRAIFRNIRGFVVYLLSGNLAEVLAVGIATLAGVPLPLLPLQILYINFVADVFPALALGVGAATDDVMDEPPRDPSEPILTRAHWIEAIGWGAVIAAVLLVIQAVGQSGFDLTDEEIVTVTFLSFGFVRIVHTFNMRRPASRLFVNEVTRNPFVWAAVAIGVMLMAAAIWIPGLAGALSVAVPGAPGWLLIGAGTIAVLLGGQAYREWESGRRRTAA